MNRSRHAAAAVVLLLAGCGGDPAPAAAPSPTQPTPTRVQTFPVRGQLLIKDWPTGWKLGAECQGPSLSSHGWQDLGAGVQVVVTDEAGVTVGVGTLGMGTVQKDYTAGEPFKVCGMPFEVADVPAGKRFYGVQVGDRGVVRFEYNQIKGAITLEIG